MERKEEQNPDVKTPGQEHQEVKEPQARPGDGDVEKGPGTDRDDVQPQKPGDDEDHEDQA